MNIAMIPRGIDGALLLETGDFLLLEDGSGILLLG